MRNKIILIVLLISVSFNIAVIIKFFAIKKEIKRECFDFYGPKRERLQKPEKPFKGFFKEKVGEKVSPFESKIKDDFDSLKKLHKEFFFMLVNEEISPEDLQEKILEMNDFSSAINKAMGENFIKYRKEISKEFLQKKFPKFDEK